MNCGAQHSINEVIGEVTRALIPTITKNEIRQRICGAFAASELYSFAWIGRYNSEKEGVIPTASAGIGEDALTGITSTEESPRAELTTEAVRTREVRVRQNLVDDPPSEEWRDHALKHDYQTYAVTPLVNEETLYGVLHLATDRPRGFGAAERESLAELGVTIAYAFENAQSPANTDSNEHKETEVDRATFTAKPEQERRLYETIISSTPDLVYAFDLDYRFIYANDALLEMWGQTFEESIGNTLLENGYEPWHAEMHEREIDQVVETKEPIRGEVAFEHAELGRRIYDYIFAPVLNDKGDVEAIAGTTRDVTERKEAEEALQESEERFRALVNASSDVVYRMSPDWSKMYRLEGQEFIADTQEPTSDWLDKYIHPDDQERVTDAIDEAIRTKSTFELEHRVKQDDGSLGWTFSRAVPRLDDDGDIVEWVGMARDITERKERERKLKESERRYRTLAENFPNGSVALFDEDLRYTAVGGELFNDLDYDPEDRIGERFTDIHPPEIIEDIKPHFKTALDGESSTFEIEHAGRHLHANTLPVGDANDEISAGMLVIQDITERKERERQLERNKEQLETLFDVLPVGVVVAEADGEIVEANDVAHEIWGGDVFDASTVEEYERYPVYDAETGEPIDPEAMTLARVLDGKEVIEPDVYEIEAADGERRIIELEGMPIRDDSGEVTRGVITISDVTERKEAQRQLAESERLYRTLAEHFPNGVVGVYDHDLRYTLAAGEKVGDPAPSVEEVEGTRMPDLYPDDVVVELEPLFRAAIEDGETGTIRTEVVGRTWQVWATPLQNAEGEIFAGLSFAQDITEQIEREQELERALDLLEKTEQIADVAGWEVDPETKEPYWSDHLFELLDVNYDEQPSLEEALDVYYTEDDRAIVEDAVEEALETGDSFDVTARFPRPAGDIGNLRVQGEPEMEDGEVVSLRGAVQDVTEQVERERQLENLVEKLEDSNERLEQFAYAASHDLQEPLRMVSSYLRLIKERYGDALDEDGHDFIEFAIDGADRMREMIDALLQYSRVDTHGAPFEPVDLDAVLEDVRNDLQVRVEETDAEITANELPCVEGDVGQLRQVFQNLLDNAIEYSGDEPPQVHVSAERDGDEWVISVHDEGVGIESEHTDRIFDVFQSLHSPEDHSGTGIGLALCERIVERHGGDIWVDSEPGVGSTFSLTLPAEGSR